MRWAWENEQNFEGWVMQVESGKSVFSVEEQGIKNAEGRVPRVWETSNHPVGHNVALEWESRGCGLVVSPQNSV